MSPGAAPRWYWRPSAVSTRCDYFAEVNVDDNLRQVSFISHTGQSSTTSEHHFLNEDGVQVATVQIVRACPVLSGGEH